VSRRIGLRSHLHYERSRRDARGAAHRRSPARTCAEGDGARNIAPRRRRQATANRRSQDLRGHEGDRAAGPSHASSTQFSRAAPSARSAHVQPASALRVCVVPSTFAVGARANTVPPQDESDRWRHPSSDGLADQRDERTADRKMRW
jgi:hypothetical protein